MPQQPTVYCDTIVLTCLAVYRTPHWPTSDVAHRCTRQKPHTVHRCPCGIEWPNPN